MAACLPVRESIRRSKAVDHLVENAKVTEVDETAKDASNSRHLARERMRALVMG